MAGGRQFRRFLPYHSGERAGDPDCGLRLGLRQSGSAFGAVFVAERLDEPCCFGFDGGKGLAVVVTRAASGSFDCASR